MPIYEYLCNFCGAEKEHLQKMNDAPIAICPACGSHDYMKRISAAGFQLKGSGWYATDFRDNKSKKTDSNNESKQTPEETKTADTSAKETKETITPSTATAD